MGSVTKYCAARRVWFLRTTPAAVSWPLIWISCIGGSITTARIACILPSCPILTTVITVYAVCFRSENVTEAGKKLAQNLQKEIPARRNKPFIGVRFLFTENTNRVGGHPLFEWPTSQATVRTDRYTAAPKFTS